MSPAIPESVGIDTGWPMHYRLPMLRFDDQSCLSISDASPGWTKTPITVRLAHSDSRIGTNRESGRFPADRRPDAAPDEVPAPCWILN